MITIETIVRQINREFVPQFEEKLRAYLVKQDKEWLIEQIVRLTLDAHSLEEMDRKHFKEQENRIRAERTERVKKLILNLEKLNEFLELYKGITREDPIDRNLLKADPPAKGTGLIPMEMRSNDGNELLQLAKDMLFGLLFGEPSINVYFNRTRRELLTLTVPRMKAHTINL